MTMITQAELRAKYSYCDGFLVSRVTGHRIAGSSDARDYRYIYIKPLKQRYHRVVWVWHHGPTDKRIDHIDRDPSNNRIENLRLCNQMQNLGNSPARKGNKSGFKGVSWSANARRWRADIAINGKTKNLGYYSTAEEAARVYDAHATKYFGEFAFTNF